MAEVVFKSNLFISNPCRLQHRHQNVSMSLKFSDPSNRVLIRSSSSSSKGVLIRSISSSSRNSQFYGPRINLIQQSTKRGNPQASNSQMTSICIGKAQKWWEKGIQPNMKEITSAQHLVDSLSNSGDQLVVLAFFSPGCGGCKALHPKLCQLAEMNPEVQFLHVNYEEHKSMCYSLNVHVLPFFRFYRGAHGRLCSFSCTNATIKKFKDALAKHSTDRCSLGPAKGLEEKELIALSANKELSFSYTPKPVVEEEKIVAEATSQSKTMQDKTLVTAGR